MSLMKAQARSLFSAVSNIDRCEPPSTDGEMPPSLPGIGVAANLPSRSAFFSMMVAGVHEPMRAMATLPCTKLSRTSVSFHVVAPADEKPCSVARPV